MGASDSKVKADPDTVLLHAGIKRGPRCPSLSPYCLKLETYLRINKIPYQFTDKGGAGAKGMVPWIEYNGESVCDSHFIMQYLNKKFNVDLNKNLSPEEKAVGTAFRIMTEEFLEYSKDLEVIVWNDNQGVQKFLEGVFPAPAPLIWIFRSKISKKAKAQGIANHTKEEIRQLAEEQLAAISAQLGDKPYLLGKEPTDVDCTMMGMLGQIKWNMEGLFHHNLVNEKFPNINDYLERMKTNFFPDWDELTSSAKTETSKTETTKSPLEDTKIPIEVK